MPGKPFQSKLNPFKDEIAALRDTDPPTTFHRIAAILNAQHPELRVSHNGVFQFVKCRSKPRKGYRIVNTPRVVAQSLKSKISDHAVTPQQTKPKTQWNLLD